MLLTPIHLYLLLEFAVQGHITLWISVAYVRRHTMAHPVPVGIGIFRNRKVSLISQVFD
ncbi:MAG: hypothetical protein QG628_977 [Patescibacteria group bacterium]|nr:hypothetical protein [Patescibacteria group bacterium]